MSRRVSSLTSLSFFSYINSFLSNHLGLLDEFLHDFLDFVPVLIVASFFHVELFCEVFGFPVEVVDQFQVATLSVSILFLDAEVNLISLTAFSSYWEKEVTEASFAQISCLSSL